MRRSLWGVLLAANFVMYLMSSSVWADGGYFVETQSMDLAQTRQEVVMAFYGDKVTYVLRSNYRGSAEDFVWVIPLPTVPDDVMVHEDAVLFDILDQMTRPEFVVGYGGGGCGCSGGAMYGELVRIEAAGQAGLYDWVVLTSSGSESLLNWLETNGYYVSDAAAGILDGYIQQNRHFLAVKVREPESISGEGDLELPPLQFTCQTSERVYPMVISQISAAGEVEVVIYTLAENRMQSSNLQTLELNETMITYDPDSPNLTNYETVFSETLQRIVDPALVTEYADNVSLGTILSAWPTMPEDLQALWSAHSATNYRDEPVGQVLFLTRLRTLMPLSAMTQDIELGDSAATDEFLHSTYYIYPTYRSLTELASGMSVTGLMLFFMGRRWRRRGGGSR